MKKPEWTENSGEEFASHYMPPAKNLGKKKAAPKRKTYSSGELLAGLLSGSPAALARAITLVESSSPKHSEQGQEILKGALPYANKSVRIGITGSPGAGKSTFIDAFGTFLCSLGHKVAALAVDPSSKISGGSILGDKTRMESLSKEKNAFIRPSPSSGALGGVARKTRESMYLCEAAGYDVILIETVGVGQSEVEVRSMTDFFLLLLLPQAGDDLQGIKKGVVELADAIAINKADGGAEAKARITKADYKKALRLFSPHTEGWEREVFAISAINNHGISEIWKNIEDFVDYTKNAGIFEERRQKQLFDWMYAMLEEGIKRKFFSNQKVRKHLPEIEEEVRKGETTPAVAVKKILGLY